MMTLETRLREVGDLLDRAAGPDVPSLPAYAPRSDRVPEAPPRGPRRLLVAAVVAAIVGVVALASFGGDRAAVDVGDGPSEGGRSEDGSAEPDASDQPVPQPAEGNAVATDGSTPEPAPSQTELVPPEAQPSEIDGMLADVPLPNGLDVPSLASDAPTSRYDLGVRVAGAVACRWIGDWAQASAAGDTTAAGAALAAMATSADWHVLSDMTAAGGYPEVLWMYVASMNGQAIQSEEHPPGHIPTPAEVWASAQPALGC
jgi:hypothetical protein